MGGAIAATWIVSFLIGTSAVFQAPLGETAQPEGSPAAESIPAATQPSTAPAAPGPAADEQVVIKPRFELHVPSLHRLVSEAHRSHSGPLAVHLGRMLIEMGSVSSEGVDLESAASLLDQMKGWPDTSVDAVTYAADNEGRQRWAVRLTWSLDDLHARLRPLLSLEAAGDLLEGLNLVPTPEGGYTIALSRETLAYLLPDGDDRSIVASHADLEFPAALYKGTEETEKDGPSLLACRLNLKGTEKDSGATFWSSFAAVSDVTYSCRVDEDGDWIEAVTAHWPPIVGTGAKAALSKVKQTYFVPEEAYGSAVFGVLGGQAMLESMAGFGPQMVMEGAGEFTMIGEVGPGPIASNVGSVMCVTILPGTGFMPVPDIVIQFKAKRVEKLLEGIREGTKDRNKLHREREEPEPWHEATVKDRPVFWSDGRTVRGGMMMPWVMRPVLFVTREIDAKDRERDFLVLGFTTTRPERLVRRWVELPRPKERRFLPEKSKTHGQLWINWQQAYKWVQPYANMALSVVSRDLLLPPAREVADDFTDALLTMKARYSGLGVSHRGPIPAGVLVVPVLLGIATATDESGGSDLARERLACSRLKVFHHHATLFKKDMGRWPAELAELDGYVDFAGHPYLLELDLSSKKQWGDWVEGLFESSAEEEEDEEEEDELVRIDDDLFVIAWGRESWTLGIVPGTFEHLESLTIDQDGNIHRVEKKPGDEPRP